MRALTLLLVRAAVASVSRVATRRVDYLGALLCALGLGGVVFALIEQPRFGWSSPAILVPLLGGAVTFAVFLAYERRVAQPMLKLELFRRRNFAGGNAETLAVYAGLAILFFFLTIFLQQVAGYSALEAGLIGSGPEGTVLPHWRGHLLGEALEGPVAAPDDLGGDVGEGDDRAELGKHGPGDDELAKLSGALAHISQQRRHDAERRCHEDDGKEEWRSHLPDCQKAIADQ